MLISNIVIPTVRYGSEVFGMSELRMQPLKKVLNISFNALLNSKKYSINRVYDELEVKDISMKRAISKTRAITKWRSSCKMIKI